MTHERTEGSPHKFWMTTCGIDTYRRSKNHARHDTPWNGFVQGRTGLVNSLWVDRIVEVFDPVEQRLRRFVKLGVRLRSWSGQAVAHGREARENLMNAIRERIPVFGFEVEPNGKALERGERVIKHFYLDRVHQLRPFIGLTAENLKEQLPIEEGFSRQEKLDDVDIIEPGYLFELIEPIDIIPGAYEAGRDLMMESQEEADSMFGEEGDDPYGELHDKVSVDEYARRALPLLIAYVRQQRDDVLVPLTYLNLAEMLDRRNRHGDPWARGLGHVLYRVTAMIDQVSTQWAETLPFLTSIIVLSHGPNAGLPGNGVSGRWPGYDSLSLMDKQAKVLAEYHRILQFGSRWNEVLQFAGLDSVLPPDNQNECNTHSGWGGGESEAHKALKRYVLTHPQLCGANSDWFAQEEYVLRSGDEIDVFFKSEKEWIGVEVKSSVSDRLPSDYERGIYQVVKYRAVLEAQARVDHPMCPPSVRILLVLESEMPQQYWHVAKSLGVNCLDRIMDN